MAAIARAFVRDRQAALLPDASLAVSDIRHFIAHYYDDAGNRTGMWLNGTRVITQRFDAANQVNGWS